MRPDPNAITFLPAAAIPSGTGRSAFAGSARESIGKWFDPALGEHLIEPPHLPMSIGKVMVVCSHCDKPTRIAHKTLDNGRRVRVCRHCGEQLEVRS